MAFGLLLYVPLLLLIGYLMKKLWLISHNHYKHGGSSTINLPPGSIWLLPFLGETLQFIAATYSKTGFYSFVQARHLRYGDCFKTNIFGETHVFVSSTESAKEILSNDLGKFTKKYIRSIGEVIGEESLLCASHQSHKLLRKHLLELVSSNSTAGFTHQFDRLVVDTLSTWEYGGNNVVILDEALKMTFKAMCKMLLSLEDGSELLMLQKDVTCVSQAMLAFPLNFPWTTFSKGLEARKRIMNMLAKMIRERRERIHSTQTTSGHDHNDFMQYLLLAREREPCSSAQPPTLTDEQIKDNILTMIIAGQDTTASAMTWMVKYLDENQGVLQALQNEVYHLESRVADKSLTFEKLNEMTYAAKVVRESLRMASIVPWFPRVALHDCKILGYTIRKGWNVNVDARSIHFDPTLYRDSHKFIPSRFDNEPKPYSYLAFGAGGRTCLGMSLARTMMLVFLFRLLTTYKWEVTDPDLSVESWALFSRLKSGCPIQITRIYNQNKFKDN